MKKYLKPILAVAIFIVMQAVSGMVFLFAGGEEGINIADHPTLLAASLILSGLLTALVLWLLHLVRLKTFNPLSINWKHAPLGIAAAVTGIIAMDLLSDQLDLPNLMQLEFRSLATSPWGILAIVLVGPVVEELVFREAIIGSLMRHGEHRWVAILFSAALFGLIHFNPAQIPFAFVMGLILGTVYAKTGNIVLTGFVHILNNAAAVAEMLTLGDEAASFSYTEALGGTIAVWIYIIAFTALCVVFLRHFWDKYRRKPHRPKQ